MTDSERDRSDRPAGSSVPASLWRPSGKERQRTRPPSLRTFNLLRSGRLKSETVIKYSHCIIAEKPGVHNVTKLPAPLLLSRQVEILIYNAIIAAAISLTQSSA